MEVKCVGSLLFESQVKGLWVRASLCHIMLASLRENHLLFASA